MAWKAWINARAWDATKLGVFLVFYSLHAWRIFYQRVCSNSFNIYIQSYPCEPHAHWRRFWYHTARPGQLFAVAFFRPDDPADIHDALSLVTFLLGGFLALAVCPSSTTQRSTSSWRLGWLLACVIVPKGYLAVYGVLNPTASLGAAVNVMLPRLTPLMLWLSFAFPLAWRLQAVLAVVYVSHLLVIIRLAAARGWPYEGAALSPAALSARVVVASAVSVLAAAAMDWRRARAAAARAAAKAAHADSNQPPDGSTTLGPRRLHHRLHLHPQQQEAQGGTAEEAGLQQLPVYRCWLGDVLAEAAARQPPTALSGGEEEADPNGGSGSATAGSRGSQYDKGSGDESAAVLTDASRRLSSLRQRRAVAASRRSADGASPPHYGSAAAGSGPTVSYAPVPSSGSVARYLTPSSVALSAYREGPAGFGQDYAHAGGYSGPPPAAATYNDGFPVPRDAASVAGNTPTGVLDPAVAAVSAAAALLGPRVRSGYSPQQHQQPHPHQHRYRSLVRMTRVHVKISGASPDQLDPNVVFSLSEALGAEGLTMTAFAARSGCVEVVLELERTRAPLTAGGDGGGGGGAGRHDGGGADGGGAAGGVGVGGGRGIVPELVRWVVSAIWKALRPLAATASAGARGTAAAAAVADGREEHGGGGGGAGKEAGMAVRAHVNGVAYVCSRRHDAGAGEGPGDAAGWHVSVSEQHAAPAVPTATGVAAGAAGAAAADPVASQRPTGSAGPADQMGAAPRGGVAYDGDVRGVGLKTWELRPGPCGNIWRPREWGEANADSTAAAGAAAAGAAREGFSPATPDSADRVWNPPWLPPARQEAPPLLALIPPCLVLSAPLSGPPSSSSSPAAAATATETAAAAISLDVSAEAGSPVPQPVLEFVLYARNLVPVGGPGMVPGVAVGGGAGTGCPEVPDVMVWQRGCFLRVLSVEQIRLAAVGAVGLGGGSADPCTGYRIRVDASDASYGLVNVAVRAANLTQILQAHQQPPPAATGGPSPPAPGPGLAADGLGPGSDALPANPWAPWAATARALLLPSALEPVVQELLQPLAEEAMCAVADGDAEGVESVSDLLGDLAAWLSWQDALPLAPAAGPGKMAPVLMGPAAAAAAAATVATTGFVDGAAYVAHSAGDNTVMSSGTCTRALASTVASSSIVTTTASECGSGARGGALGSLQGLSPHFIRQTVESCVGRDAAGGGRNHLYDWSSGAARHLFADDLDFSSGGGAAVATAGGVDSGPVRPPPVAAAAPYGRAAAAPGGAAEGGGRPRMLAGGRLDLREAVAGAEVRARSWGGGSGSVEAAATATAAAFLERQRVMDERHWTLLEHAARSGWPETLRLLLGLQPQGLLGPPAGPGVAPGGAELGQQHLGLFSPFRIPRAAPRGTLEVIPGGAAADPYPLHPLHDLPGRGVSSSSLATGAEGWRGRPAAAAVAPVVAMPAGAAAMVGTVPTAATLALAAAEEPTATATADIVLGPSLLHLAAGSGVAAAVDAVEAASHHGSGRHPCGTYGTWATLSTPVADDEEGCLSGEGPGGVFGSGGPSWLPAARGGAAAAAAAVTPLHVAAALDDGGALLSYILYRYDDAREMYDKVLPGACASPAEVAAATGNAAAVVGLVAAAPAMGP